MTALRDKAGLGEFPFDGCFFLSCTRSEEHLGLILLKNSC